MTRLWTRTSLSIVLAVSSIACHEPASMPDGVSALSVAPASVVLMADDSAPLLATALSTSGAVMTDPTIAWASQDSSLIRVNQRGRVFAVRAGTTMVTASVGTKVASSIVTGTYPPLTGVRLYAHRGFGSVFPENTLIAADSALAHGADGIEADFQLTSDSVAVIIHDATVDRTTNGTGTIAGMTVAQARTLNACAKSGAQWGSCQIPLAEELIQKVKGRGLLIVDLKGPWPESQLRKLLGAVRESGMTDATMVTSFDINHLRRVRKLDARITLGWLQGTTSDPTPVLDLGKAAVIPEEGGMRKQPAASAAFDSAVVARGGILGAWTIYSAGAVPGLRAIGVRWFIANIPLDKSTLMPR